MQNDHLRLITHLTDGLHPISQVPILCGRIGKAGVKASGSFQCGTTVRDVTREEVAEAIAADAMLIEDVEWRAGHPTFDPDYVRESAKRAHRRLEPSLLRDRVVVGKDHHVACRLRDTEVSSRGWAAASTLYQRYAVVKIDDGVDSTAGVVDDNHLKLHLDLLVKHRPQTAMQELGAILRRDDNGQGWSSRPFR
jgi:hypothetical protein